MNKTENTDYSGEKRLLRKEIKKRIISLTEEYKLFADERIRNSVLSLPEYKAARTVFAFAGTSGEINTLPLIEKMLFDGKRVGVPLCESSGIMSVKEIKSINELTEGSFGILEPDKNAPTLTPYEIDFAVIPCLSCDHDGRRLGKGGGYYDRYMENTSFVKALICREKLMLDKVPVIEHDILPDILITESIIKRMQTYKQ